MPEDNSGTSMHRVVQWKSTDVSEKHLAQLACCLPQAVFFFALLLNPENEDYVFLLKVG
jgi:hypothetical protein